MSAPSPTLIADAWELAARAAPRNEARQALLFLRFKHFAAARRRMPIMHEIAQILAADFNAARVICARDRGIII